MLLSQFLRSLLEECAQAGSSLGPGHLGVRLVHAGQAAEAALQLLQARLVRRPARARPPGPPQTRARPPPAHAGPAAAPGSSTATMPCQPGIAMGESVAGVRTLATWCSPHHSIASQRSWLPVTYVPAQGVLLHMPGMHTGCASTASCSQLGKGPAPG